MKSFLSRIPNSIKFSFLPILGLLLLAVEAAGVFPKDYAGNICGVVNAGEIGFAMFVVGTFIVVSLAISGVKKMLIRWRLSGMRLFLFLVSLFAILVFIGLQVIIVAPPRDSSRAQRAMTDLRQLATAQELFYNDKGYYASTQQEIVAAEIFNTEIPSPYTGEPYTDKDEQGIEGGDTDPNTWSASVFIPRLEYGGFCQVVSDGSWFTCDQEGCRYE